MPLRKKTQKGGPSREQGQRRLGGSVNLPLSFLHNNAISAAKLSLTITAIVYFLTVVRTSLSLLSIATADGGTEATVVKASSNSNVVVESIDTAAPSRDSQMVPHEYLWNGREIVDQTARASNPVTDKVTRHQYHIMYGENLLPYYYVHPNMKIMEIGLGCDMRYGTSCVLRWCCRGLCCRLTCSYLHLSLILSLQ